MRRNVQHLQSEEVRLLSPTQRWLITFALLIGLIYAFTPEASWKPRLTSWTDWMEDSEQSVSARAGRSPRGLRGDALARARQRLAAKRGIPSIDEVAIDAAAPQNLAEPQLVAATENKDPQKDEKKKTVDGKRKSRSRRSIAMHRNLLPTAEAMAQTPARWPPRL
jgi:hypothetical protein